MKLPNLKDCAAASGDPASRCAWVFGQPMKPCPHCGGYKLGYQTPIKMDDPVGEGDGAKEILRKYARSVKGGATPLVGPVYMWCQTCFHKGPSVDCSGRTAEDVGRDAKVAAEVRRLWNTQPSSVV